MLHDRRLRTLVDGIYAVEIIRIGNLRMNFLKGDALEGVNGY